MTPAATLKALREQAGLTQEKLAAKASVNRSWLNQMERGKRPIGPSPAAKLAKVLGVSPAEFGAEKPRQPEYRSLHDRLEALEADRKRDRADFDRAVRGVLARLADLEAGQQTRARAVDRRRKGNGDASCQRLPLAQLPERSPAFSVPCRHVLRAYARPIPFATAGKVRNLMERTTVMSKKPLRRTLVVAVALSFVFVASASAAGPNVGWTTKDMKTAVRAIGYPKPHPKKLACKGSGATTSGQFASFRCIARYAHHRRRVFFIEGQGEGGWLCAGKTLTGCNLLRHGFVTAAAVSVQGLGASVDLAARGYMVNRYGSYQAQGFCRQASSSWSCPFVSATVTITLKAAKGGYVETGNSQLK